MQINKVLGSIAISLAAFATASAFAQAPAGSTGECKDGTYTSAKSERGACSRHGGVKTWFAESKAKEPAKAAKETTKPAKEATKPAKETTKPAKETTKPAKETTKAAKKTTKPAKETTKPAKESSGAAKATTESPAYTGTSEAPAKAASKPASGAAATSGAARTEAPAAGGPGMVWVNTPTKVYHCSGDQWYGKTKTGEYMSETEAKAKGYRPSRNKPCG